MNLLDLIIIVSISLAFLLGWKLRAIHLIGMFFALFLSIGIANRYHEQMLSFFHRLPPAINLPIAWLATFLISIIAISILVTFISKTFELIRLKWLDRLLGAGLAVAFTSTLLIIFLLVINILAQTFDWKIVDQSVFAKPLLKSIQPMIKKRMYNYPKMKKVFI